MIAFRVQIGRGKLEEFAEQRAQFRVRRVEPSGVKSGSITVSGLAGSRASGYPRIARYRNDIVFAWTASADGRTQVRTAVAPLAAQSQQRQPGGK